MAQSLLSSNDGAKYAKASGAFGAMTSFRLEMGVRKWVNNPAATSQLLLRIEPYIKIDVAGGAPSTFNISYFGEGLFDGLGWVETGYSDGPLASDEFLLRLQFDHANTRVILEAWDYYGNRHAQRIVTGAVAANWSPTDLLMFAPPAGTSGEVDFVRVYNTVLAPGAAAPSRVLAGTPVHAYEFEGNLNDTGSATAINAVYQGGGVAVYGVEPFAPTVAPVLSSATWSTDHVALVFTDTNSGSTNENYVDVERRDGTGNWRGLGWAAADATTYNDTLAKHATTYDYRVRARNRFGVTAYSNVVSVTTGAGVDTNPVIVENAKTGTASWNLTSPATAREIEGYADQVSVNRGGTINFKVNSLAAENFNLEVFRMGWYGGLGARRIRNVTNVTGTAQTVAAEIDLGSSQYIREMAWTTSYSLALTDADPTEWPSGVYLARLTQVTAGKQSYIIFTVRDDTRQSKYMFDSPVFTYQMYNAWPTTPSVASGRSSYYFNSIGTNPTKEVSYNRPYGISQRADGAYGMGAGELLVLLGAPSGDFTTRGIRTAGTEYNLLRWMEKEGLDVQYCTDMDLHVSGESVWNRCYTILFMGHAEYWSRTMRDTVRAARDYGRHLAFYSANSCFWQVLIQPAHTAGTPNRAIFAIKDLGGASGRGGIDQTVKWRDLPLAHPDGYEAEYNLIGVQYQGDPADTTMTIELAGTDPIMAGTGLTTGSTIPGVIGCEWDNESVDGASAKPGRKRIAHSSFVGGTGYGGPSPTADMVYWTNDPTPGPASRAGAKVLGTGTMQIPWALDDYGVGLGRPTSVLHTGMQQLVRNLMADQGEAVITEAGGGGGGGGAGIATHLKILQQPSGFAFGSSCDTPAIIAVVDDDENVVTDYSGQVTVLGLGSVLSGPTTLWFYSGIATFRRLAGRTLGALTLSFSTTGLVGVTATPTTVGPAIGTFRGVVELPRVVPVRRDPVAPIIQVVSGGALQAALNTAAALTAANGGLLDRTFIVNDGVCPAFVLPNRSADATGLISIEGSSAPSAVGTRATKAMMGARAVFTSADGSVAAIATELSDGSEVAHDYRLAFASARMEDPSFSYFCISLGTAGSDQDALAKEPHHIYFDRFVADGGDHDIFHTLGANCRYIYGADSSFINGHHFSQDGNAIACWNGSGQHFFGNCGIQGSGEGYIYGGGDPSIPELIPSDITFAACTNSRPVEWNRNNFPTTGWEVKNNVDLKNCQRLHEYGCETENSWVDGQNGSLYNIKSVNQENGAPWCGSSDILIELGVRRNAESIFELAGNPENKEASPLCRVLIVGNVAWNCPKHVGNGGGSHFDVSIIHNTYSGGVNGWGIHVGEDGDQHTRFVYKDNLVTADDLKTVTAQGEIMPDALTDKMPGAVFTPNVWGNPNPTYGAESDFPAGNHLTGVTTANIGFTLTDMTGWDTVDMALVVQRFRLLNSSPWHLTASDGLDFGADIDAILAALGGVVITPPPPDTAVALNMVRETTGGVAGAAFPVQPQVEILDENGARLLTSAAVVTAGYYTGTGALLGTVAVAAVAGLVTWPNLGADTAGPKVIRYTSPGLTPVDNDPINVTSGVWGAVDLLRRFKRMAGLPDVNEESDALDLYPILAAAQGEVVRQIAMRTASVLYSVQGPTKLVPSADRKTFTFGTDGNGNPILPLGWVQISPRKSALTNDASYLWVEGVDFMNEGTQIRIMHDRTHAGDLWGRWIPTPPDISATVEPVLQPADARILIILQAVEDWASEGNTRPDLVASCRTQWGHPKVSATGKFDLWMMTYKRQYRGGGGLLDPALWYLYAPDLGRNGG